MHPATDSVCCIQGYIAIAPDGREFAKVNKPVDFVVQYTLKSSSTFPVLDDITLVYYVWASESVFYDTYDSLNQLPV